MSLLRRVHRLAHRLLGRAVPVRLPMRDDSRYTQYDIGVATYGEPRVYAFDGRATLRVGGYCSIADDVSILLGGEHALDAGSTFPFDVMYPSLGLTSARPGHGGVTIGSDVWIGHGATILSDVTIGDGAVIGAGSLVTRPVAPYSVAFGVPARHARFRFDEPTVAALLAAKWWDLPHEQVLRLASLLIGTDTAALLHAVEQARHS